VVFCVDYKCLLNRVKKDEDIGYARVSTIKQNLKRCMEVLERVRAEKYLGEL